MTEQVLAPDTGASDGLPPLEAVPAPRGAAHHFALKHGDTFLVTDAFGDIRGAGDGLFRDDTRVLSRFDLTLAGQPPSLLGAAVSEDNVFFTSHVTNRPLPPLGGRSIPEGVIHIERARFLWQERLYERLAVSNYSDFDTTVPLTIGFTADFRDMFEVRGSSRPMRGDIAPPQVGGDSVLLRYEGLDDLVRTSVIAFSAAPQKLTAGRADFMIAVRKHDCVELYIEVGRDRPALPGRARFRAAAARARFSMRAGRRRGGRLRSSGRLFNNWIDKSRADLALLTTELPTGPYPYAGIPWFSTPFGRDAIVTALQTVWLDPALARGVLTFLSQNQAYETSQFQDSAPGKIMHETRKGEMTALGELPFRKYYGGVDTTPLFVMLAGAYATRTADLAFIDQLWPSLEAAMGWIEDQSGANGHGFLDYARGAETGLANQGWKDSSDSIFHADGRTPDGPIALVEVQGYVYAALRAMADLARRRNELESAAHWLARAQALRTAVEDRFWMPELGFYGLATDGHGELCRVRASNAGHLLFVGLPSDDRAARVAEQLMSAPFNTGWGVRTLAHGAARFNPMSYHNGSVWPHDTAICAAGLARYGHRRGVVRLLSEAFEAAVHFGMRLPELFCGFPRSPGESPIAYPVACLPQAWSSGAVFMILQACLGLQIDAWRREIHIDRPSLPIGIDRMALQGLAVGDARIDLVFQRVGERVVVFSEGGDQDSVRILSRI
ncbi:amylo-alpha-1,6-glucosidase [Vineibacter terrae]|uniref:Amylo-alpha-1,6-glucosidase n=1 Tax=Vineibacter terrae TaxID=2586908 RepID=A0A5C8PTI5_9HYPH|nr:amylo-alpha-1,6-glucosidase [Vineibacter terrae]TXL81628.1 amylo-alpha-1,6-glucosidase [Vineibacter terrae]